MKGMNLGEYVVMMEFLQKYHRFALWLTDEQVKERNKKFFQMHGTFGSHGLNIKYVDCTYDSRDADIWAVTFRQGRYGVRLACNHYTALDTPPKNFKFSSLFEWSMAYLKGEWKPSKEFHVDLDKS